MNAHGIFKPLVIVCLVLSISLFGAIFPIAGPQPGRALAPPAAPPLHFDQDASADLVVGIPHEDDGGRNQQGAFQVFYGASPGGLSAALNDVWGPFDSVAEASDYFGDSLATGDFDGDRYVDLAVGIPYEDLVSTATMTNAGAIEVWYGAAAGLDSGSAQMWHQDSAGVDSLTEEGDLFGYSLAAGDFNRDHYVDLAIGVPYEDFYTTNHDGILHVFYGSAAGLASTTGNYFTQANPGALQPASPDYAITEPAESGDRFARVLASGDFNGDGFADLAIGVPNENIEAGSYEDAGMVHILYGSSAGLTTTGWQYFTHPSADDYMEFGAALTAGDFNGDGRDDLAIGSPDSDLPGLPHAGSVRVLYGSASGLTSTGAQNWDLGAGGEVYGQYGFALSAGDYNKDGKDDLAIGIPFEDVPSKTDCGAVEILYGASGGLYRRSGGYYDYWHQDRNYMEDGYDDNDQFGYSLASGDFNRDGYFDLAIGVPYEDIDDPGDEEGAVHVMYGGAGGIGTTNNWFFHQGTADVEGSPEPDDHFGLVLAASKTNLWLFLPMIRK